VLVRALLPFSIVSASVILCATCVLVTEALAVEAAAAAAAADADGDAGRVSAI
jgi:hypothetical protein